MSKKEPSSEEPTVDRMELASGFPTATDEDWHGLVQRILGDRSLEDTLVRKTYDGIPIRPLYTAGDWPAVDEMSGFPGLPPFTRGNRLTGQSVSGWDVRQLHIHPDPEVCNRQILEDLERGVTSVELRLDRAGRRGLDAARPGAADDAGIDGAMISVVGDLDRLLDGVFLDACAISMRSGASFMAMAGMLFAVLARRGVEPALFTGSLNADPLAALAEFGELPGAADGALSHLGHLARHVAATYPAATAVAVDTCCYHDAGASEAQELACALATGAAYIRAMTAAGLELEAAFDQMAFTFSVDANLFLSIAKLRAARRVWGRVAEACGAPKAARGMRLHATTSMRMLSQRDPWVNILRGTVAALAASVAGVDSLTVLPFTAALGLPVSAARRIARNTQLVLQQESSLNRVLDPAGGSWAIENLTDAMAQEAWTLFQKIEREGGMLASLQSGNLQARIVAVSADRARHIADLSDPLTGTSAFPNLQEQPVAVETVDLATLRQNAVSKVQKAKGRLPAMSGDAAGNEICAALTAGARDGVPLATLVDAVSGGGQARVAPLVRWRLGEEFEKLRDASHAHQQKTGRAPAAFLATIGALARFTAAAAYARNFLAAGGIDAIAGEGGTDAAAIGKAFQASGADVAVICSDKAGLEAFGADVAAALGKAGAREVYVVGRPADLKSSAKTVDGFFHEGCDVKAALQGILERMGILQR